MKIILRSIVHNFQNEKIFRIVFFSIFSLTSLNAIYNSLSSALGGGVATTTFLMPPHDLFGDYFKAIFSFTSENTNINIPGFDRIGNIINGYLQNNPYKNINNLTGLPSNLNGLPLSTLYAFTNLFLINYVNPFYLYLYVIIFIGLAYLLLINSFIINKSERIYFIFSVIISYPILFIIVRGHLLSLLTTLFIFSYAFFLHKSKINIALFFLAVACNIRPNSVIFLPLIIILSNKISLEFIILGLFRFLIIFILIFSGCLLIVNNIYDIYNLNNFMSSLKGYHSNYVISSAGLPFGSSLLGGFKFFLGYKSYLEPIILIFSAGSVVYSIYLYFLNRLDITSFVFILCSFYCLSTSVFSDYYLGIFFLPIIFFSLNYKYRHHDKILNYIQIITCVIMLSPKNYFFNNDISYQVFINPFILLFSVVYTFYLNHKKLNW